MLFKPDFNGKMIYIKGIHVPCYVVSYEIRPEVEAGIIVIPLSYYI